MDAFHSFGSLLGELYTVALPCVYTLSLVSIRTGADKVIFFYFSPIQFVDKLCLDMQDDGNIPFGLQLSIHPMMDLMELLLDCGSSHGHVKMFIIIIQIIHKHNNDSAHSDVLPPRAFQVCNHANGHYIYIRCSSAHTEFFRRSFPLNTILWSFFSGGKRG